MKIAYGVHGYGRGHSSRALAVLPELTARHLVRVYAGGDAYAALAGEYHPVRLPVFRYALREDGQRNPWRTVRWAVSNALDLVFDGPARQMVCEDLRDFGPDVILSDSEPWTHWAGRRMGIPRISYDHFAVLVYCDWPMRGWDRWVNRMEACLYKRMMACPSDRTVIVSFHAPPVRSDTVTVVGPVLRELVRRAQPSVGDYLLVYFSNGKVHYTARIEQALQQLASPVVVYGVGREGRDGNLEYRPPSNTRFVADLAGARAVFATAGNQLISEAMHFRKPLLLKPEDALEQRLNAEAIQKMGIGRGVKGPEVDVALLRQFLADADRYAGAFGPPPPDGLREAVEAIERAAEELSGRAS